MPITKPGILYLGESRLIYAGHGIQAEMHEHFAFSILISLSDSFRIRPQDGEEILCQGAIVHSNVAHALHAGAADMLVLQFDPDSVTARHSERRESIHPFNTTHLRCFEKLRVLFDEKTDCLLAWSLFDEVLHELQYAETAAPELNAHILQVIKILKTNSSEIIPLEDLCQSTGISGDRLMRLFKEAMGIPIRRYHLWIRLRQVAYLLKEGMNLTRAAHEAGFSDSAHLSRTFKSMFGVPPSEFLAGNSGVRVRFC
ncbi:MAG: helix-turn-helix transcriptional regulator [Leptospiraceae bacterium]|nr:helix-turn-helix transcriptional regulator [Leptospiraceae bacterium]MCB1316562.1 helix-turn-helix transcriptional regulator [Leptospiraceae bacterium]MCB1322245.1 helix-turn-helix transcriptional regulator [Leptospiraceae bacterium]